MLDFYLLPDDQSAPSYPEETGLKFIGGLDDQTFERLKHKKIIADRFDYYADFRWDTTLVRQIREYISTKQMLADKDVRQLIELLDIADDAGSGIIAYAD